MDKDSPPRDIKKEIERRAANLQLLNIKSMSAAGAGANGGVGVGEPGKSDPISEKISSRVNEDPGQTKSHGSQGGFTTNTI